MKVFLIILVALSHSVNANSDVEAMPNFDLTKFQNTNWWVSNRQVKLYDEERCVTVAFDNASGSLKFVIGNSASKTQFLSYPAKSTPKGWDFDMGNEGQISVIVVYTDYKTVAVLLMLINENGQVKQSWIIYSSNSDITEDELSAEITRNAKQFASLNQVPKNVPTINNAGCSLATSFPPKQ